jgi:glycogen operon protein
MMNAYWEPLEFEVPRPDGTGAWRRIIDTALDAPDDICEWADARAVRGPTYAVRPRSIVLLLAKAT